MNTLYHVCQIYWGSLMGIDTHSGEVTVKICPFYAPAIQKGI